MIRNQTNTIVIEMVLIDVSRIKLSLKLKAEKNSIINLFKLN